MNAAFYKIPAMCSRKRAGLLLRVVILTASFMAAGSSDSAAPVQQSGFDLLIRNARVLDGTGNPWFPADLGTRGGRIVAVGRIGDVPAGRVVDAAGRFVAPGFIDLHSHSDRGLANADLRFNINMIAQGITLSVVNQDGRSPRWPIRGQREDYERHGLGNNVALLVGHGTVRSRVMSDRAHEKATDADVSAMQAMVDEGMRDGAFGLSTGLEYAPGRYSDPAEVIAVTRPVKPYGGFYISHERSEGSDPMWKAASDPSPSVDLLQAVQETIAIGRATGVPVVCSHLKAKGAHYWGASHAATRLIRDARMEGVEVYADQYTYDTSGSDGDTVLIPRWAFVPRGAAEGQGASDVEPSRDLKANLRAHLQDATSAARLRRDIEHEISRRGGARRIVVYEFPEHRYVGQSLAAIAADRGIPVVEAVLWLQLNGHARPGGGRMRGFSLSEEDVEHIMQQEFTATCTDGETVHKGDGVPHARSYGTYPRKIRRYVVERGTISLPFAIRSMTSLPAQIMGLKDRGVIREGAWADLVVFDLDRIADRAGYTDPHRYPEGIPFVFVNGVAVVENGQFTKATPGRVLTPARDSWRYAR